VQLRSNPRGLRRVEPSEKSARIHHILRALDHAASTPDKSPPPPTNDGRAGTAYGRDVCQISYSVHIAFRFPIRPTLSWDSPSAVHGVPDLYMCKKPGVRGTLRPSGGQQLDRGATHRHLQRRTACHRCCSSVTPLYAWLCQTLSDVEAVTSACRTWNVRQTTARSSGREGCHRSPSREATAARRRRDVTSVAAML